MAGSVRPLRLLGHFARTVGVLVVVLAAVLLIGSCDWIPSAPAPLPTAIPAPTPTPRPTATATPVAGPMPATGVLHGATQDEAQMVVRAWFDAMLGQDYRTAADLTVGAAADRTRELSEGFRRATGGAPVRLVRQRLDLSPAPSPDGGGQAVRADFEVPVNAQAGPFVMEVERLRGSATFVVGRLEGRPRITDIRDVTGLPVAQGRGQGQ